MTTQDLDPSATAEDEAPPSPESDGNEQAAPEQDENERERELQRRLTQQGRETAEARRAAALAQNQASVLTSTVQELQSQVQLLTAHLGEQQRADQARQQQELDNYLATLPPEERLDRKIQILNEQVKQLQTAATPSRPVQSAPAPQQPQPQQQTSSDDATLQYMKDRAIAIVNEAEAEFGVKVDVSQLADGDWESEEAFYKAVMKRAARGNGEAMPKKPPATETPQQMQARIRREVEEQLGVSSPNGPRPAAARAHKPTEDDVKSAVNSYSSAKGPKAQVQKLREMRERMG